MQKNFTNDGFEDFLRQNAEDVKMYPSDAVWKSISKDLNKRRRRFAFSLTALVVSVSLIGYQIMDSAKSLPESFKGFASAEMGSSAKAPDQDQNETNTKTNNLTVASVNPNVKRNYNLKANRNNTINNSQLSVSSLQPQERRSQLSTELEQPIIIALNPQRFSNIQDQTENISTKNESVVTEDEVKESVPTLTDKIEEEKQEADIEKAITKIQKSKNSKLDLQLYFTPTVSYRKLSENKTYLGSAPQPNGPNNLAVLYDVNSLVTHKPAIGLELGYTAKYAIDKNIKLKGGLQFNINRYDIKAFYNSTELATISLNNSNTGSINTITNYRSYGTNENTNWLENMYFQASVPLGAEVKLYSNNNVQFGVASTVQPTYVIGDRAYVISSDYKNYAEVPWLVRRFNVNTAFETFVGYSTGKLNWQVGPQVRYQLFSSFIEKYPVKENLFDFGLKVGISLNK